MNIFVGHLAPTVTSDDLRTTFSTYGTVINALIMRDTIHDKPLGYGHVYLVPDENAQRAIQELNRMVLRGRPMVVRMSLDRVRKDRRLKQIPWDAPERRQGSRRSNGHGLDSQHTLFPGTKT
ncbi:MAG: RNA-binding protein [Pseudomonadota bacterium]